ncbi:putative short-chain dehydrogenase/reductase SDR [Rosa chinensis]|uniref:Putative short-chain dehydrogenase/reductase SDR n=1 Tax=Rosa chinensis TaxID=74649 RepID=A0A2P6P766_ROSCH|nr:putative short-chain dehydrogenase/reductase SDR [Rosa chinensis]
MAETTINFGSKKIAVVTGANKGIGLEISKQLASKGVGVVLTARDAKRGTEAAESLKASGFSDVVFHQLDVTAPTSIASLANFLKTQFRKLDILVKQNTVQTYETAADCLKTNYYGIKQLTEALVPLLQKSEAPKIVNVSSTLGQLRELGDADNLTEEKVDKLVEEFLEDVKHDSIESKGWPLDISAYIVSKAALNAYTRVVAKKYPHIAINAVSPGYTKTDLNNNTGILTVEEAALGPVKLALIAETGISGLFFDRTEDSTFD